jgi:hypothetical protein
MTNVKEERDNALYNLARALEKLSPEDVDPYKNTDRINRVCNTFSLIYDVVDQAYASNSNVSAASINIINIIEIYKYIVENLIISLFIKLDDEMLFRILDEIKTNMLTTRELNAKK